LKAHKSIKKKSQHLIISKNLESKKAREIFFQMKFHSNQWDLQKIVTNAEYKYCKTM
jgi:hypothetical protein